MSNKTKRYILPEDEIPRYWYNIQADMVTKPMPPLHPSTKQPQKAEDLYPLFAEELCPFGARIRTGESTGYSGTYLFQERKCKPDGITQTEFCHSASLLLQKRGCNKRYNRNRSRTMGGVTGICR